jgi:hypothetical protein
VTRPGPLRTAINHALADGEWMTVDELLRVGHPTIEPGRAIRLAKYYRDKSRKRHSRHLSRESATYPGAVLTGARLLLVQCLHNGKRKGTLESASRDGVTVWRLSRRHVCRVSQEQHQ